MRGLNLAKNYLKCESCYTLRESLKKSPQELEKFLREKFSQAIFVAWQVQSIVWGKFDGERLLLKENLSPNFEDWLECRIFNDSAEVHLKRIEKNFVGRYICDEAGDEEIFYVDSFSRFWGKKSSVADGWITLCDKPRKISMEIPCDDGEQKYYGLTTRNYIGSDETTGLSGYIDYRFVAIDSAWDGD